MVVLAVTAGLSLIWNRYNSVSDKLDRWNDRLDVLIGRIESIMGDPQSAATRKTTIDCPRINEEVEIITNRLEGETAEEHSDRHIEEVEAQQEACKIN